MFCPESPFPSFNAVVFPFGGWDLQFQSFYQKNVQSDKTMMHALEELVRWILQLFSFLRARRF
jgi:hypothetical protein